MSPTCGILTVSDTCFSKEKQDTSGRDLATAFKKSFPNFEILKDVVPDDLQEIINKLNKWSERCNIILTTGGTGFSPRDVTPEATRAVIEREAPGLSYAMISKSLEITPMAMLSRAVCGIKNKTLIVNLPGSAKGALECFAFIKDCLPHAVAVITDDKEAVKKVHGDVQNGVLCGPSKVVTDNVAERPRESTYAMLEIDEASDLIVKQCDIGVEVEQVEIEKALHRVLAEDVLSYDDIPPFDVSIMDGYAVIAADGDGPRRVRNALGAGDAAFSCKGGVKNVFQPLKSGEVVRITTGAPIPAGADAVVPVEFTEVLKKEGGEEVEININKAPIKGQDIRLLGSDVPKNIVVLRQGERLKAAHIGVLAAVGKSKVTVYKPVSVGIFTTGNELREHYEELQPGQIRDSNRLTIINLLKEYHYDCDDHGIVRDEPDTIKKAIATALSTNDILITTGGVSMGEFDFMKRVLIDDFNATIHFGRVNVKPGKPTTFATLMHQGSKKLVFCLPGNPVSSSVMCLRFVIPALRHLEGATRWQFAFIPHAVSVREQSSNPRPEYVRAVVKYGDGKMVAEPNGGQISSRLNSLVGANGLMLMPGSMRPLKEYQSHIILIDDLLPL